LASVWCASVAQLLRDAGPPQDWLSVSEHQRLAGITSPRRRDQFIAGRWLVRLSLVALCGGVPRDWAVSAQPDAAPQVEGGPLIALAHSGEFVACALADHAIGIDIEDHARRELDVAALSELSLNDREQRVMSQAPAGNARRAVFLAHWTLKEAWIKATGDKPDLTSIDAARAGENEANARVWQTARYTLALVGLDAGTSLTVAGDEAPQGAPEPWRVRLTSA